VACPSVAQCTVVDHQGREATFNPRAPGSPTLRTIDGTQDLVGVACPSASQCTAVDASGRELTFNPTARVRPRPVVIDDGVGGVNFLSSVSCPSVLECMAVGTAGQEVVFNPKASGVPAPVMIAGANSFSPGDGGAGPVIACPSVSECVAVDGMGNAFVGRAPNSNEPPASARAPRISGLAVLGETLSARRGSWTNRPAAYS
jgi:hypothetical protein